jgi:magnesium chelatase subunit I
MYHPFLLLSQNFGGKMTTRNKPRTIGELKASGYQTVSVKVELRRNLVAKIKKQQDSFPGIIGYDDTVIPLIQNAVISGQDIIFLGERGQAKSRLMRALVNLLDEEIPAIKDCEINDDPYSPICKQCREKIAREKDNTEIVWLTRDDRYSEKLATPDISIADLIGDVDPIKVAEGKYLSDELTIHYGLIPRTNRGIFCINELPDLAERLQVGLFNLMEERDIQIRGYRIRLPLDLFLVASANPEDYTNRGRIITPLKDRFGAQVRTHYPTTVRDEITIMEMERRTFREDGIEIFIPPYMKEIVAEITHLARKSGDINQRSGVSVRISIGNYETIVANAIRRAVSLNEKIAVPRISDLPYIQASMGSKIELEGFEETRESKIIEELTRKAIFNVFNRRFNTGKLEQIVMQFAEGFSVETSDIMPSKNYLRNAKDIIGLLEAVRSIADSEKPEVIASAIELLLEGLHVNKRLNKTRQEGKIIYRK